MAETSFSQESQTMPLCISTSTKNQEPSKVGNSRTDPLISNHQVAQLTSKSGKLTPSGGRLSNTEVRTLSTQEAKALMSLVESITRAKTSSLPTETTR